MKIIFSTIVVFWLGMILSSCDKDCVESTGINDEWQWVKSVGLGTITPEIVGYTKRLEIDDFTYKEFTDNLLTFESDYDLVIREDTLLEDKKYIEFENGDTYRIEINESDLVLDPEGPDAFIEYYKRK